jgi:hypothetical protein
MNDLPPGELVPPGDAQLLSEGRVIGMPPPDGGPDDSPDARPGPHITWTAYTSEEAPDALAKRYLASLGTEAHAVEGDTNIWRFPREKPVDVLEVSPASAEGPWTYDGTPVPPQAKSIIMISSIARFD